MNKIAWEIIIIVIVILTGLYLWGSNRSEIVVDHFTFTQSKGSVNYSIDLPLGWFAHENGPSVIFTQSEELDIPQNTELYAIGPNFYITVNSLTDIEGITTFREWLDINGMTGKSELFISSEMVEINGKEMLRVLTEGAGVGGNVLHYLYLANLKDFVTLSQFPFDPETEISQVFEDVVKTFES
jgi:hypothetical protein